jgi:hypothetical protein
VEDLTNVITISTYKAKRLICLLLPIGARISQEITLIASHCLRQNSKQTKKVNQSATGLKLKQCQSF